jgi:hypothetical protein
MKDDRRELFLPFCHYFFHYTTGYTHPLYPFCLHVTSGNFPVIAPLTNQRKRAISVSKPYLVAPLRSAPAATPGTPRASPPRRRPHLPRCPAPHPRRRARRRPLSPRARHWPRPGRRPPAPAPSRPAPCLHGCRRCHERRCWHAQLNWRRRGRGVPCRPCARCARAPSRSRAWSSGRSRRRRGGPCRGPRRRSPVSHSSSADASGASGTRRGSTTRTTSLQLYSSTVSIDRSSAPRQWFGGDAFPSRGLRWLWFLQGRPH